MKSRMYNQCINCTLIAEMYSQEDESEDVTTEVRVYNECTVLFAKMYTVQCITSALWCLQSTIRRTTARM